MTLRQRRYAIAYAALFIMGMISIHSIDAGRPETAQWMWMLLPAVFGFLYMTGRHQ